MNDRRREKIGKIVDALLDINEKLRDIQADEEAEYDNMPESLQDSERGETSEECLNILDDAIYDLEDIIDNLANISMDLI